MRKLATIMRTRLCIHPVCQSSRRPASTIGYPVSARSHALMKSGLLPQGKPSNSDFQFSWPSVGKWNSKYCENSRQPISARTPRRLRDCFACACAFQRCQRSVPHLARTNFPKPQMRAQPTGAFDARKIAILSIAVENCIQPALQLLGRAFFTGPMQFVPPLRPIDGTWRQGQFCGRKGIGRRFEVYAGDRVG